MGKIKEAMSRLHLIKKILVKRNNNIHIPKSVKIKIEINGKNNTIEIADNVIINEGTIKIFGNNSLIRIGEKTRFQKINFWLEDNGSKIIIGRNCNFCGEADISCIEGHTIKIGNNLLVSRNFSIVNGDSHSIIDLNGKRINKSTDMVIEDHVWIGKNVSILKGGSIGQDTIVGANSLVTKNFKNKHNVVLAGNPAKVIREQVNWDHKRF